MDKEIKEILTYVKSVYGETLSKAFQEGYGPELHVHLRKSMVYDIFLATQNSLPDKLDKELIRDFIMIKCINDEIQIDLDSKAEKRISQEASYRRFIAFGGEKMTKLYYDFENTDSNEKQVVEDLYTILSLLEQVMEYYLFGKRVFERPEDTFKDVAGFGLYESVIRTLKRFLNSEECKQMKGDRKFDWTHYINLIME